MMIVWRTRGKIIGTVLCCIAYDSCAQRYTHTRAVFYDDDDDDDEGICRARHKQSSGVLPISQTGGPSNVERTSEGRVAVRRAAGKLFQMTGPATAKLLIPSVNVDLTRAHSNTTIHAEVQTPRFSIADCCWFRFTFCPWLWINSNNFVEHSHT